MNALRMFLSVTQQAKWIFLNTPPAPRAYRIGHGFIKGAEKIEGKTDTALGEQLLNPGWKGVILSIANSAWRPNFLG
jgi:hypothetical protein